MRLWATVIFFAIFTPFQTSPQPQFEFRNLEPIFRTREQSYQLPKGGTAELECIVDNLGDNTIVWKQGERVITAGSVKVRKDSRMSLVETYFQSHNLQIKNLNHIDSGNYTCEVEWQGQPRDITHTLKVLEPPQITHPHGGSNIFVNEGEDVRVSCTALGDPSPEISWKKVIEGGYVQDLVSNDDPGYLNLGKVQVEDRGEYICEAKNTVTNDLVSIHLHINYQPMVHSDQIIIHSGEGAKVDMTCLVEGYPQPVVNWFRISGGPGMDVALTQDNNYIISSDGPRYHLRIRSVTRLDLYSNFSCEASNEQGRARQEIELTGRPEAPTINSTPEGLFANSFELAFTVKSFSLVRNVEILYRKKALDIKMGITG